MQPVMVHSPIMAQGIRWRAAPWLQSVRAAAPSWASTVMAWEAGAQSSAPAKAAACPAAGRTASSTSSNMALSLASISVTSKQFVRRNFDLPQDRHSAPSNAGRVKTYRCPGRAEQIHGPPDLRPPRGTQDVSSGTRLRSGDLIAWRAPRPIWSFLRPPPTVGRWSSAPSSWPRRPCHAAVRLWPWQWRPDDGNHRSC